MSDTVIKSTLDGKVLVIETSDGPVTYDSKFLVAALLIYVAKGDGAIDQQEASRMIDLIEDHFKLQGAESLELLTHAMSEMAERPNLGASLAQLGQSLSDQEKEDIALMALKVIAADGRRDVAELEQFNNAVAAADIPPDIVHRAFDRYFSETMPDVGDDS
jgi:uncharacterized tellurite resistance protein B-like protein